MIKVVISILFVVFIFFVFGGADAVKSLFQTFADFTKGVWESAKMYLCSQVLNSPTFYISAAVFLVGIFITFFACHTKKEKNNVWKVIGIVMDIVGIVGIIIDFFV